MSRPPEDPLLLAVYGTLRRGDGGRRRAGLGPGDLEDLGPCRIPGVLVDLGAYPGLLEGDGAVVGELVRCADPAVLARIDAFEGHDPDLPHDPLFVRRPVTLLEPEGLRASAYLFAAPTGGAPEIPGGDWMAHRGEGRRPTPDRDPR